VCGKIAMQRGGDRMKTLLLVVAVGAFASTAGAVVLWDQMPGTGYGFASQDFESAYDAYDVVGGDDFLVGDPGWSVESIDWSAITSYGSAYANKVTVYFWKPRGDGFGDYYGGAYATRVAGAMSIVSGNNSITFDTPVALPPGVFFLGIQPQIDFATYGQHYWDTVGATVYGKEFRIINPGNGFGMGTDWFAPAAGYDAAFRLNGQIVPEPGVVSLAGLLLGAGALWLRRK
jgi:hypothetical protein